MYIVLFSFLSRFSVDVKTHTQKLYPYAHMMESEWNRIGLARVDGWRGRSRENYRLYSKINKSMYM